MIKSTAGILQTQTSPADNRTRKKRNISAQENMPISFLKSFYFLFFLNIFLYPKIVTTN